MEKYSIVINRLRIASDRSVENFVQEMGGHEYSDDEGWGYHDVQRDGDVIYCTLQKRSPVYYSLWNEEIQQLERKQIQVVREVCFEMDFKQGYILSEGTNTQLNLVKQSLRQLFWGELIYCPLDAIPYDYISILSRDKMLNTVKEITINDFKYEGVLLGRYIARMISPVSIDEKLSRHAKNVIRAKLTFTQHGDACELTVNNKNVMAVTCSEEAKKNFIDYLKQNLK